MKNMIIRNLCIGLGAIVLASCTNLDETLYDQVESNNFYNTRKDVERIVARPLEHCYHMLQYRHFLQELPSDQIITPSRDDGGMTAVAGVAIITIPGRPRTIILNSCGTVVSKA